MSRRQLRTGAPAGGAGLSVPAGQLGAVAAAEPLGQISPQVVRRIVELNGRATHVFGLQRVDGLAGVRCRAGDAFDVLLRNETAEPTIVHWHGLTPPWPSDGVADAPTPLVAAGAGRTFDFPVGSLGTYGAHARALQEQALLAAPLIVADPADDDKEAQFRALAPPVAQTFAMTSTDDMTAYRWGIEISEPIPVDPGDRLEVTARNARMMALAMHLQGHHFEVLRSQAVFCRDGRRHCVGAADVLGHHRRGRRQSGPSGLPLPPSLPHGGKHDVELRLSSLEPEAGTEAPFAVRFRDNASRSETAGEIR